jgi:hypothetical protein
VPGLFVGTGTGGGGGGGAEGGDGAGALGARTGWFGGVGTVGERGIYGVVLRSYIVIGRAQSIHGVLHDSFLQRSLLACFYETRLTNFQQGLLSGGEFHEFLSLDTKKAAFVSEDRYEFPLLSAFSSSRSCC